jgi:5-(carboxyamino)imidazole ribonucleotide synthase
LLLLRFLVIKGQVLLKQKEDIETAWNKMKQMKADSAILESFIDFEKEVSVIISRSPHGTKKIFPVAENEHSHHILKKTTVPANISEDVKRQAEEAALIIAEKIDLVGVLAVEMFVTKDQKILVNEMAPRPHNSGHWSIEGSSVSQFEQLVRSITNLPLGNIHLRARNITMTNLIGDEVNQWPSFLKEDNTHLHLYGKSESRPGRKMGHVTQLFI